MKKIITISLFFILGHFAFSTIIHVPNDQPTIQDAIDIAQAGDTILVSPGTYYENINFDGKNITVASHFILENDLSFIESTIIDGSQPVHPDTASCVLFISGEDSTAVLAGFTITGGKGTVWEDEHNQGFFYTEGGGILVQYASPTIRNNVIEYNEAINKPEGVTSAGGGGIRAGDSNPHIFNNMILHNQGRYGGGIVLNFSGADIKNNIIAYNTGGEDYGGGGIWCYGNGDNPKIMVNNTIVENHSVHAGGGIRIWSAAVTIMNSIFWGNTAAAGGQIYGSGTVSYSDIEDGYPGTANIEEDPLLEPQNLILSDNSPCIDSGMPEIAYDDPEDPDMPGYALFPAKGGLRNDMGAYGGPGCFPFPFVITSIKDIADTDHSNHLQVYPNPSRGLMHIKMPEVNTNSHILIYDLTGKLVLDKFSVTNPISIDTRSWKTGFYTYQITSGKNYFSGKISVK